MTIALNPQDKEAGAWPAAVAVLWGVGGYATRPNRTALGGQLSVFALPDAN